MTRDPAGFTLKPSECAFGSREVRHHTLTGVGLFGAEARAHGLVRHQFHVVRATRSTPTFFPSFRRSLVPGPRRAVQEPSATTGLVRPAVHHVLGGAGEGSVSLPGGQRPSTSARAGRET